MLHFVELFSQAQYKNLSIHFGMCICFFRHPVRRKLGTTSAIVSNEIPLFKRDIRGWSACSYVLKG